MSLPIVPLLWGYSSWCVRGLHSVKPYARNKYNRICVNINMFYFLFVTNISILFSSTYTSNCQSKTNQSQNFLYKWNKARELGNFSEVRLPSKGYFLENGFWLYDIHLWWSFWAKLLQNPLIYLRLKMQKLFVWLFKVMIHPHFNHWTRKPHMILYVQTWYKLNYLKTIAWIMQYSHKNGINLQFLGINGKLL